MPKSIAELIGPDRDIKAVDPMWSMFIHQWPATQFWEAFIERLQHHHGWSREKIRRFLQSEENRHLFVSAEPGIEALAKQYADIVLDKSVDVGR